MNLFILIQPKHVDRTRSRLFSLKSVLKELYTSLCALYNKSLTKGVMYPRTGVEVTAPQYLRVKMNKMLPTTDPYPFCQWSVKF